MTDAANTWDACTSALQLDRWLCGELSRADSSAVDAHVAACQRCSEAARALRAAAAEPLPPLRAQGGAARSRRWRWPALSLPVAGAGAALAAGVLLLVRLTPETAPSTGVKGAGVGIGMYVRHGSEVRRAAPGETLSPGDAVRFAVTSSAGAYVAVLSVDPEGRASVYFPVGPVAAPVAAGVDTPLPLGTRLDDTVGEERIWALFCDRPIELEPVRAALERGRGAAPFPGGCQVSEWSFVKR